MISLKDIPAAWKFGTGGLAAVLTMMAYLSTYQTDLEAQQYQQYANSQVAQLRVQQAEQQIAGYRYQLLSAILTPQQREWILKEIERLEVQIACIRAGTC